MKKNWNRPELTVLVRTRAEEAILGSCKNAIPGAIGTASQNSQCFITNDGFGGCIDICQAQPNS
ncbi:hypothetical protein JW998_03905 [candidate division KSB1 bacterium]|nr:hypothetical protein [candidate division KSB1 bacterium]